MNKMMAICLCWLLIVPLCACSLPKSKANPIYYYTLDKTSTSINAKALPYVLRIDRFTAGPPFNTQRMVYGDKGLHRNAYANFKWIAEPGEMLAYALARDLQQANLFQAVLPPGADCPPTHTLQGWVEEFIEEDYESPAQATVSISINLIDDNQLDPVKRILFQKRYHAKAPCSEKTPAAFSVAMSEATQQMFDQVIQDIYNHLAIPTP